MLPHLHSRRSFLAKSVQAGIASYSFIQGVSAFVPSHERENENQHLTILFQGDSITDGNRGRSADPNHIMGHGYAFSIASRVGARFPEKGLSFYNRGVSGNTITDMAERWEKDTLAISPNVISILIGVNDTNSVVNKKSPVTVEKYEEVYRLLLQQTYQQFPDCLLVLCEPFILPVGNIKRNWDGWKEDITKRQKLVLELSTEFHTVFVPLQQVFLDACKKASADYWIWDGIHPTYSGHELITKEWLKQTSKRLPSLRKLC